MTGLLSFVFFFGLLVFAHEFGHFIMAKLFRVRVDEFGFGYPPRMTRLGQWRETTITLNWLPFGGFVRMAEDDPTVESSLATKSRTTRALVLAAGSLMNLVLAVLLFSLTFMIGTLVPVEGEGTGIYYVVPGSPAEKAGLRLGDTIVVIDGEPIDNMEEATELIGARHGQPLEIVVRRDGKVLEPILATPRVNPPEGEGALGVSLSLPLDRRSYPVWEAVPLGLRATYNVVGGMYYGLKAMFRKEIPFELTGPLGIYTATAEAAKSGLVRLLEFAGFLSINLFLVNLLPLPALDGGRLIFILLEWVRGGKRVPPEKEGLVHAVGMMLLLGLMAVVTVFDYMRYFG